MTLKCMGVVGLCLVSVSTPARAQQEIDVDLASSATLTRTLAPGRYHVVLVNRAPVNGYTVSALVEILPFPALPPLPSPTTDRHPFRQPSTKCLAVDALAHTIETTQSESTIAQTVSALIPYFNDKACGEKAQAAVGRTRQAIGDYALRSNQKLTVTVQRTDPAKSGRAISWVNEFDTPAVGEWHTSYGAAFVIEPGFRGSSPISGREAFVPRHIHDTITVVAHAASRQWVQALPSVVFTYMPLDDMGNAHSYGWAAGVGTDFTTTFQAFVGFGWTVWQNVTLSTGVAAARASVGLPQYRVGDTLATSAKTTFEARQLNEDAFRFRPYVGISFRFASAPSSTASSAPQKVSTPSDTSKSKATASDSANAGGVKDSTTKDSTSAGSAQGDTTGKTRAGAATTGSQPAKTPAANADSASTSPTKAAPSTNATPKATRAAATRARPKRSKKSKGSSP